MENNQNDLPDEPDKASDGVLTEDNQTPFKLPANVRALVFLVSLPGLVLLGLLVYRFIRDGFQADLSWFALVYGGISCLMLRLVIRGRW